MSILAIVLIVILVIALFGVIPHYPYSTGWGYGPSGLIGVLLIIVIILLLMGRL